MAYRGLNGILNRAEERRISEIVAGYFMSEEQSGEFKTVFDTTRGTKGKFSKPSKSISLSDTDDNRLFPISTHIVWDLSDYGLNEVGVTEMERSCLSHKEAVDYLGLPEVVDRDVNYFIQHKDKGVIYDDFKPQNIHYFDSEQGLEPKAIDVFDEEAELIKWRGYSQQLSNPLAFYIEGNEKYDGIADKYDVSVPGAEIYVMDALGITEPETYIGGEKMDQKPDPYIDLQIAVEEQLL